ncbi:hypothetical protein F0562_020815 [Nyssa sinensis]|uniref:MADS-box domain-containing protein n=1 Tax=Nyssa sinensis TaxID=561372 RepID=A0A5J5BST9_9ASTE|nr:hypothetical protein F0562_020815 [Nyssa sinensis]
MDKKSKGRQKIKMAKIKSESNLQVTFSKRRSGIFKKANELSTLCGAQVGIIVFSPGNKAFSFGHPGVESVVDRFLSRNPLPPAHSFMDQLVEAQRDVNVHELNMYLSHVENLVESEKKHGEAINQMWVSGNETPSWMTAPIHELNLQQLEFLKARMEELKQKVAEKTDQLVREAMNPLPFDANAPGIGGSSMTYHGFNHGYGPGRNSLIVSDMAKKASMGRQKIKMAKIEIKNHLQVTFSKRRSGLFKKASELCTLCGVEITIIVFSPAGKVFSFGHPNVESIIDRFLTRNPQPNSTMLHMVEAHRNASVRELNSQLTQLLNELEAEKKRGETLDHMRKASRNQCWWEAPIDELGLHELEQLKDSMEELKKNVNNQANKVLAEAANPLPFFTVNGTEIIDPFGRKPNQIHAAGSSNSHVHDFNYGQGFF